MLVLVLVAASTILVSGSREWVSGSAGDVVLGATVLHGRGSDVAPGALAAALVGMASVVVAATSGAAVRIIAASSAVLAAVLGATVVIQVLVDPGEALGRLAAAGTGRSGTLVVHGQAGAWAWLALAALVVMGVGGLGGLVGRRRWQGLSSRYDAGEPVAASGAAGAAGASGTSGSSGASGSSASSGSATIVSAWDQLSLGEDPTAGP